MSEALHSASGSSGMGVSLKRFLISTTIPSAGDASIYLGPAK